MKSTLTSMRNFKSTIRIFFRERVCELSQTWEGWWCGLNWGTDVYISIGVTMMAIAAVGLVCARCVCYPSVVGAGCLSAWAGFPAGRPNMEEFSNSFNFCLNTVGLADPPSPLPLAVFLARSVMARPRMHSP
jgi:hypothetical protein